MIGFENGLIAKVENNGNTAWSKKLGLNKITGLEVINGILIVADSSGTITFLNDNE